MRWRRFEDAWKLEKRSVLHVLNVARYHKSDRYGRSSIYRSLNVRISCVISIVQNSVNIQITTWLGKRMLEQCTYDCTKPLLFSKTLYLSSLSFIFASMSFKHLSSIRNPLHFRSFLHQSFTFMSFTFHAAFIFMLLY